MLMFENLVGRHHGLNVPGKLTVHLNFIIGSKLHVINSSWNKLVFDINHRKLLLVTPQNVAEDSLTKSLIDVCVCGGGGGVWSPASFKLCGAEYDPSIYLCILNGLAL